MVNCFPLAQRSVNATECLAIISVAIPDISFLVVESLVFIFFLRRTKIFFSVYERLAMNLSRCSEANQHLECRLKKSFMTEIL